MLIHNSKPRYYAGIGARTTPSNILALMTQIAIKLEERGYVLRSGGADGADTAFSHGAKNKEVFVPWDGFNGIKLEHPIPDEAFNIAKFYHPAYDVLSQGVKKLMARNTMQLLGPKLREKSEFVVCWTKDGCSSSLERTKNTGGTGQAIHIASELGVPVFNLSREDHRARIDRFLEH
jgi:hypothetical protein